MPSPDYALISSSLPFFKAACLLRSSEAVEFPQNYGEKLRAALTQWEPPAHKDEVKYAVAALLDESLMRSAWPGRTGWSQHSFQWTLFQETLAGVNFFERLTRLRQEANRNIALLEVFYLCLILGFQGKYALSGEEALQALQTDLKQQINGHRGEPPLALFPQITQTVSPRKPLGLSMGKILGFCALSLCLLYAGFALGLHALEKGVFHEVSL
jgi:type VI secretion system protein ImpK